MTDIIFCGRKAKKAALDDSSPGRSSKRSSGSSGRMWGSSGGGGSSGRRGHRSSSHRSSAKSNTLNDDAIQKMFADISDEDDSQVAGMEGISKLCDDLGIDPLEDIRILVLLWKLGANAKPAQINKLEWKQGCEKLQVDSVEKFSKMLPSLDIGFLDRTEFKDFYKFCFQFNRQGTHRTLDKDLVTALLQMVLKGRVPDDRLGSFSDFLNQSKDETYSRITLDQWTSFLDFCYEVEDISNYDEATSAWPVLIDEYVEYMETL